MINVISLPLHALDKEAPGSGASPATLSISRAKEELFELQLGRPN
ncbi:hypothetical protein [Bradyrhizobium shewense]|nr:hypothetical protein [Bradyrhizobium shewense]